MGKSKKSTKLLEKDEPEQLMPDQLLYSIDTERHETKLYKKIIKENSNKKTILEASIDRTYENAKPKLSDKERKEVLMTKLKEEELNILNKNNPDEVVQNYEYQAPSKKVTSRKVPEVIVNNKIRDIWGEENIEINPIDKHGVPEYVASSVPRKYRFDRNEANKHVLPGLSSVKIPHAESYNPQPEVYKKTLEIAEEIHNKEAAIEIKYREIKNAPLTGRFVKAIAEEPEEVSEAEEEVDANDLPIKQKTTPLTKKDRNQKQRRIIHEEAIQKGKLKRKMAEQVDQLDSIIKDVTESNNSTKGEKPTKIAKIRGMRFQKQFPVLAAPEDLKQTARLIKPVGSLVGDQYRNLERRNMVEQMKKKVVVEKKIKYYGERNNLII